MLSESEVKSIASLARIGLHEKEIGKYQKDLSEMLDYFKKLNELDTKNTEPISHITGMENIMREDRQSSFKNVEAIKELFPEKKGGYNKAKTVF